MDLTQPQYIFPILKHADILQCMSELGVELTKAELVEPQRHKERVRRVFVALVRLCVQKNGFTLYRFSKVSCLSTFLFDSSMSVLAWQKMIWPR